MLTVPSAPGFPCSSDQAGVTSPPIRASHCISYRGLGIHPAFFGGTAIPCPLARVFRILLFEMLVQRKSKNQ
jgi:hypothetical protein